MYHTDVELYTCVALYRTRVNEANARSKWENKCTRQHGQMRKNTKFMLSFSYNLLLHPPISNGGFAHIVGISIGSIVIWCGERKTNNPAIIYLHAAKVTPTTMKCSLFKSKHMNGECERNSRYRHSRKYIHFIFIPHMSKKQLRTNAYKCRKSAI